MSATDTSQMPPFNGLNAGKAGFSPRVGNKDTCANCDAPYVVKTKDQKCCCDRCRIEYWHAVKGNLPKRLVALERRLAAIESSVRQLIDLNLDRRTADLEKHIGIVNK
jgi:hypothetical protein